MGLRAAHYGAILEGRLDVEIAEAITENFIGRGGRPIAVLEHVRRDAEIALHGVSLSIGDVEPLDRAYLREVRRLRERVGAAIVSDHLCFGRAHGYYGHDLWPLPYTEEAIAHVAGRVLEVQEILGTRILLENVSSYVTYKASEMAEWDFVSEILSRGDCKLLLDVNNVYVSSVNHDFDPRAYLDALPFDCVGQYHLAGHLDKGTHLLDDHGAPVPDSVLDLYRHALLRFGPAPTIVEWDERVPPLDELVAESRRVRSFELFVTEGSAA
ncbi:DUF692 domain-containing protein [Sorangium sp. So ce302]|uniref:MNIO family bufferin maturase n=1 Tax=Sorangium sp. So ce302 TaxID=3133297 RepID=UPI003F624602